MTYRNTIQMSSRILLSGTIAVAFTITGCGSKGGEQETQENSISNVTAEKNEQNKMVADYVTFVKNDGIKMSLDHERSNAALLKLNDAIESFAMQIGYDVKEDLSISRKYADMITGNPNETTHADNIRNSAEVLATVLQNMQAAKYPGLAAQAQTVKDAASGIDPDVLTLDQQDKVSGFFVQAADLLTRMNNEPSL